LVSSLILLILAAPGDCQTPASQIPTTKGEKSAFLLPEKQSKLTFIEQKGRTQYDFYCALCHGPVGNGDGFNSYTLTTPPAKLADPALMAKLSDDKIKRVIKEGGSAHSLSPIMPSWSGLLKAKDIESLVAYIRTLSRPSGVVK
jgi:mono/diheme cytochrome c family protein